MGRAFEYRKARKMARWSAMSTTFTKIGKEISMSVKAGGSDPNTNSRLRAAMQNARSANMPKANVEAAIKKATDKDASNYEEVNYEGYGPNGVAIFIETATDNTTRTVANMRTIFNKGGGSIGTSGSLDFVFERKANFTVKNTGINVEELELELIDAGLEEIEADAEEIFIVTRFADFGAMQKALEGKGFEILSAEKVRTPLSTVEVTPEQREAIDKMVEKFEEDDDVQQVFTNMA
ncbi:MAG TPA: YebC/PmpR family DNA-binding transcriptional regulator [Flavobacteriales bacterium]|nr:YebC/PmpR family DNA-binding transcriptional regulator [Flavobacteriales bacterium]HRE74447.1 YebC/PmpR family DNA-binding transcriptional regulator [Flavobacteriales bacterium]HRJ35304.1 YebC/PmpR family DNA-binding transcriptional regulator [Flavobacteriales bacterium]HRJ38915.1 YebC/PmpR family DNA-binding transcriptional regulator [Flavobacteriales bacterium]